MFHDEGNNVTYSECGREVIHGDVSGDLVKQSFSRFVPMSHASAVGYRVLVDRGSK